MKKISYIILTIWVISFSCQARRDIQLYYIEIAPIGNSDYPRYTLYITMKKLDKTLNKLYVYSQIITDENTLIQLK